MPIESMMTPYEGEAAEPMEVEVLMPGQQAPVEPAAEAGNHRENLAELLEDDEMAQLATDILDDYENDDATRSDWMNTYKKGLDFLGFSLEDRSKPFKGASGVFHPIMAEAVVRFQSNAIQEIFPASGPVLTNVMGSDTTEKVNQAKRVKEELNYQLTENMCEYRTETEQKLFRLPLSGSVFKKVYYDQLKKRPYSCMVTAEDLVVNYGATEIEHVERIFHVVRKSANEVKKLMRAGVYRFVELPKPVQMVPEGRSKEDKLLGVKARPDRDNRHTLIEAHVHVNLPGIFEDPDGIADPYIITVDKDTKKVLSIYRNWAEGDQLRNREQYFVHYQYIPGLGFYGFGLAHLMGSVAKATTSILRQLVDAGTLSNLPGGLKTRGLKMKGEDTPIQPGEWRDVDLPPGAIGDNLFPLPYKEPSAVLVALLEMLVDEGRRIGSIADLEISSASQNAPVGTTLALMERSLKVMSAIHARLHASLRKELKLIGAVISNYMDPKYEWDDQGQFDRRADFDGRVDIIPVSDPNAATQAQKIVQLQAVQQLAAMNPELYNLKELHRVALQAIGVKDDERILPVDQPPPLMDPVQENMAILTSQPIKVYPEQDHTAHIQVHLSFATDPKILEMVQASPNAQKFQGAWEAHVSEHLAYQYRGEIEQIMGVELPPMGEPLPPEIENHLSRLVADASVRLREKHDAEAQKKAAEEVAQDPVFQLRQREVAIKERKQSLDEDKARMDAVMDIAKTASDEAMEIRRIESEEARAGAKIGADLTTFGAQLEHDERMKAVEIGQAVGDSIHQRSHEQYIAEMDRQEKERDRQNKIDVAKAKPKPKPAAK